MFLGVWVVFFLFYGSLGDRSVCVCVGEGGRVWMCTYTGSVFWSGSRCLDLCYNI